MDRVHSDMREGGEATHAPPLLASKLTPPALPAGFVSRPDVVAALRSEIGHRVALISAPAGWGKTTLLSEWLDADQERQHFGWVSLDPADRDPGRFWAYVIEALARSSEALKDALSRLRQPASRPAGVALSDLVAALGERREPPATIVLDDAHLAVAGDVAENLGWFIEHMPSGLSVVIASREQPPLPLGRLRARGHLGELRAPDLRFMPLEAGALLSSICGNGLADRHVARLLDRTEGWVAGLYLAGLSLRGRDDPGAFVEQFAGDDRHLVDYLGPEVIERQPLHVREFMARTSILERLSAPLCDAVTGRSDSVEMLAYLERANLFLVPLDARREWFRYHHLFVELLQGELRRSGEPLADELHRRAARWHRDQGLVAGAVRHALAGGDVDVAAELVARHWLPFSNRGRVATVAGWLASLPESVVTEDPRLALAAAWTALAQGRLTDVEGWLEAAAAAEREPSLPGASSVDSSVAMARSVWCAQGGEMGAAVEVARRAARLEPDGSGPGRARALAALGEYLYWLGDFSSARGPLREAADVGQATDQYAAAVRALGYLAVVHAEQEEWAHARRRADEALDLARSARLDDLPDAAPAHLARGVALRADGAGQEAIDALRRAVELTTRGAGPIPAGAARIELARAHHALGHRAEGEGELRDARAALRDSPDPGMIVERLAEVERELGLSPRAEWPSSSGSAEPLTDRETAVLSLLPTALSQREIATQLFVSRNTVKTHIRGLYRKLGVSSRAEAVRRARELGLL